MIECVMEGPAGNRPLVALDVRDVRDRLGDLDLTGSEGDLIELVASLEEVKCAAAAAQARVTAALYAARRAADAARGVDLAETARSVGSQVALARKEAPFRGSRLLGLAQALTRELPQTFAAMSGGAVSEWVATQVAAQTACLSPELRRQVDAEIAPSLPSLSARQARGRAARLTASADAASVVRRNAAAVASRRVSLRPAPDGMSILSAILPLADGVAAYAALRTSADAAPASTPALGLGARMADLLVERVTGRHPAKGYDVELRLVMSVDSLVCAGEDAADGDGDDAAYLEGCGGVPAAWARAIVAAAGRTGAGESEVREARAFVRRLFTHPGDSGMVQLESSSREFRGLLRESIVARDQSCRMPFCDAPIRHVDHIRRAADGGPTSLDNGQGLCERCNYVKEAAGWAQRRAPDREEHVVVTTTPTGHVYESWPTPLPGTVRIASPLELHLSRLLDAA